jgi:hypothetical protein
MKYKYKKYVGYNDIFDRVESIVKLAPNKKDMIIQLENFRLELDEIVSARENIE